MFHVYYSENPGLISNLQTPEKLDLRKGYKLMCEVEGTDPEVVFRRMNVVTGDREYEIPLQLRCRSMCVGDVIVDEKGRGLFCAPCGWESIEVVL